MCWGTSQEFLILAENGWSIHVGFRKSRQIFHLLYLLTNGRWIPSIFNAAVITAVCRNSSLMGTLKWLLKVIPAGDRHVLWSFLMKTKRQQTVKLGNKNFPEALHRYAFRSCLCPRKRRFGDKMSFYSASFFILSKGHQSGWLTAQLLTGFVHRAYRSHRWTPL